MHNLGITFELHFLTQIVRLFFRLIEGGRIQ